VDAVVHAKENHWGYGCMSREEEKEGAAKSTETRLYSLMSVGMTGKKISCFLVATAKN
jgi:hypothetical protein